MHYQGLAINGSDVDRQTKTAVERKKIGELAKEAAYELLNCYSVKKMVDQ